MSQQTQTQNNEMNEQDFEGWRKKAGFPVPDIHEDGKYRLEIGGEEISSPGSDLSTVLFHLGGITDASDVESVADAIQGKADRYTKKLRELEDQDAEPEADVDALTAERFAECEAREFLPESKREFAVRDRESADWVVGKLLDLDAREARLKEGYEAAKLEVKRERDFFKRRFGADLENVVLRELASSGGKKKSFALLNGTVGFRTSPERIEIGDEDLAKHWARSHAPAAIVVKVTEGLLKKELLSVMKKSGEVPDGCDYEPPAQKFFVSEPK